MAEQRDPVGERHFRRQVVVRMDVDVPQSGISQAPRRSIAVAPCAAGALPSVRIS
jgi:hypothetical protein